jgi:elongation factor Tu
MRTSEKTYAFPPDVEAEITFVPTEQGGRSTPAFSGYRGQFFYDGHDWDADQEYPDVESVLPGQTVRALLRFASPEMHEGRLRPGTEFQVREGARIVARGKVTKILHLEESASRVKSKR